ncbi:MAG TPA: pantoate--beta-alanine ligase [Pyrinomonadaceae bacterium]|jgi:pantoate--beta-alanine ligase|nr:pantoate--beta-alanine ligase [Pyrinomonadaceae bacterium]
MEVIDSRVRMMSIAHELRRANRTIGFVPTMGALHEGHLSLVREARAKCDVVVVSIFVNPAQFDRPEDLSSYPRDLKRDLALLGECNVDYVFAPSAEEIYPAGFSTYVAVDRLADKLEGSSRPGHFRGVTTVVAILLNIVKPDFAFFGQKDAQQAIVIKQMARDLALDTEIVVRPIVREESGLAMSSRNQHLNDEQRRAATVLLQALLEARSAYENGERNAARLIETVRRAIEQEPLARIDYVSVNDAETLEELERVSDGAALLSLAVFIGETRLIDNIVLGQPVQNVVTVSA